MSVNEKMTAIADAIRSKTGGTDKLGLDAMASSIGDVYDKGRDSFWEDYQQSGNRVDYRYAFAHLWTDEIYTPKYPLITSTSYFADAIFYNNQIITDTKVPITAVGRFVNTFYICRKLKRVPLITLDNVTTITNPFVNCESLEDVTFGGVIQVSLPIQQSPKLSRASVQSVVDHLKDLTGSTAQTLTLHPDVKAWVELDNDLMSTIEDKNWTLA